MARFPILFVCLFIMGSAAYGQAILWEFRGGVPEELIAALPQKTDSVLLASTIDQALSVIQNEGYLLARVIQTEYDGRGWRIALDEGERYTWARLSAGNLHAGLQNRIGFRPGRYEMTAVSRNSLERLFERILRESERNGYPLASVRLDSVQLQGPAVSAILNYIPGPEVTYGKLVLSDSTIVRNEWLQAYLDIREGDTFDQRTLNDLETRLDDLEFINVNGPVSVGYRGASAFVNLPVQRQRANRVDAVIGFLPNEENDGGLRVTGEAELHLDNLFSSGKMFDLHWQRMRPETQFLRIAYYHPNLFRSNVDISGDFQLLKEDTTFINRDAGLRFTYRNGRHMISFLSRFRASRLLEVPSGLEMLPEVADFNLSDYGLAYVYQDRRPGWQGYRGLYLSSDFRAGNKKIRRNTAFPPEFYEGLDENILQLSAEANVQWGFLTGKQTLLYQHLRAGWMDADILFQNDLYRLGGFRSVRGFNENQFFARRYALYTLEWQVYVDASSYIMAFIDQAFYRSLDRSNNPTGLGAGIALQTGGGLLQLAYAVGRDADRGFDFRLSKFHFGYKAKF